MCPGQGQMQPRLGVCGNDQAAKDSGRSTNAASAHALKEFLLVVVSKSDRPLRERDVPNSTSSTARHGESELKKKKLVS